MRAKLRFFGLVVVTLLAGVAGPLGLSSAGATPTVPYTDPNAVGYIGLCNQSGQQITSGNINTTPFVALAVSSEPAPAPYNNAERSAILDAYLPIQVLAPGDWSGEEMTSDTMYSNAQVPMAAATDRDSSLADFISDYPPKWDGFLQLRMYLGTEGQEAYTVHYPTLNIQVVGDTWTAVGGGNVNCSAGTAQSLESVVLGNRDTAPNSSAGSGSGARGTSTGDSPRPSGTTTGGATSSGGSTATTKPQSGTAPVSSVSRSSYNGILAGLIAVALVLIAALVAVLMKRRRLASAASPTGSDGGKIEGGMVRRGRQS